jgi:hypothetical protein
MGIILANINQLLLTNTTYFNCINIFLSISDAPLWRPMINIYVKDFFISLAMPSDYGQ